MGSALLKRSLKLLDLRGEGAWQAGVNAAICASPLPAEPQQWARYFYKTYSEVDGLVYSNAHNAAVAYALFERADGALNVENDLPLADPRLRLRLLAAAAALNLALID